MDRTSEICETIIEDLTSVQSQKEKKKSGTERIFKEIMAKHFGKKTLIYRLKKLSKLQIG